MSTESRVILINSRVFEGWKVFLGAIGIFNCSKRVSNRQRAVAQWDEGGGSLSRTMKKSSRM